MTYIVLRDPKHRLGDYEGRWYLSSDFKDVERNYWGAVPLVLHPTGRFEVRDDGALAEVWEAEP